MRGSMMRSLLRSARRSVADSMGTLGSSGTVSSPTTSATLAELMAAEDWDGVRAMLSATVTAPPDDNYDEEADERRRRRRAAAMMAVAEMEHCRDCPAGSNAMHYACRFRPPVDAIRSLEEVAAAAALPDDGGGGDDDNGCDMFSAEDCASRLPLHYAVKYGASPGVVSLLLRRSPPSAASHRDVVGKAPLHHAAESYASHYRPPFEAGSFDMGGGAGGILTAEVRRAALRDDMKLVVKLLLRAAPSVINVEDDTGMTPIEYAIDSEEPCADISVIKYMQKSSERCWKRMEEEEQRRRRHRTAAAALALRREKEEEERSRRSRTPQSELLRPPTTAPPLDVERAIADLLLEGSMNLAAVSSVLDKTAVLDGEGGKDRACTSAGRAGINGVRIPFEPRRRMSPRALCA
uniref:Uncharacterized protein n=1 Tax=Odontella aurita TaxID=265563 RepID=A0A7S4MX63_9STRA|mmetsp:Transcript_38049/g.113629  ORF Transcript_38049/g.113629 Transcript_38049/m.113629 type:complete len:407 (+) Transcript_38049:847-2067(+)